MRVLIVAGARPNFMKVAPILAELRKRGDSPILVHTGQHYDAQMSQTFFEDLGIPNPDYHLGVGPGSHALQTARVMEAFEPVLEIVQPEWVVVVGDVNSTLACALVTAKYQGEAGTRVAHVEAGLRSRDWDMPEEVNRVLTDRLSDLLLIPSRDAGENLYAEGVDPRKVVFVGNVMIDTLLSRLPAARSLDVPARLGLLRDAYAVVTLHRPSNVDSAENLAEVLVALRRIARQMPVVLPLHPRTRDRVVQFNLDSFISPIRVLEPLGYTEMLSLVEGASVVLTDSGGLQEETTVLGIPCVTLRANTERPITIESGTNKLTKWPLSAAGVFESFVDAQRSGRVAVAQRTPEGWDGRAAERIVGALRRAAVDRSQAIAGGAERVGR